METIQLVTVTNDTYARHLAVMLHSLLENKMTQKPIHIYVLHTHLSEQIKTKLTKAVQKFNVKPRFLSVHPSTYQGFVTRWHFTEEVYYRISIPDLLDQSIQKAIYLDCDLIVKEDITQLWNTNIERYFLAAVEDKKVGNSRNEIFSIPMNPGYFNAGVLVLNLTKWRKDDISAKTIQYIKNNPSKILLCCQDPLNAVVQGRWLKLDPTWNYQTAHVTSSPKPVNPAVIHFTEYAKPWNYGHPLQEEYFKYLRKTLWEN